MTLPQLFKNISKGEWVFVALLSAALMVITTAPAVYGWLYTPPDHIFTAMHFVSADDWFVYYSLINQGKAGQLLFNDLFAAVPHLAVLRPEWLVVSWLAAAFNLPAPVAFHLARITLIPPLVAVSYLFLSYFFKDLLWRKFALSMLLFSSGVGVIFIYRLFLYPTNFFVDHFRWPMDLWVPDINTFLTMFTSPHFIIGTILLFAILLLTVLFVEAWRFSYALWSGVLALALFWIHPFQVIKLFLVMGAFFGCLMLRDKKLDWRLVRYGAIVSVLSSPAIGYYLWLLKVDWLTAQRALQNINPTTPLYLTLVSFGGLGICAVGAAWYLIREKKIWQTPYLLLIAWALAQLAMLYAPIAYQRRTGLGFHFPLVVLAVFGMGHLYQRYHGFIHKHAAMVVVSGLLIFLPSTLFALAADVMVYSQQREDSYLHLDEYEGYTWLREHTAAGSIIFSSVRTGNILPAYALRTSYVGHAVETPLFNDKKIEPSWFFASNREKTIEQAFLRERGIDYLFYGARERKLGVYDPAIKTYLLSVYESETVSIYQVL